jgi:hypothetical protein
MNKPLRVALVAFIVGLTMLLQPPKAFAATGFADITCGDPITGEQMTFSTGWDNSNPYFEGRGNIAQLYCEGGWAGPYTIYISDSLPADSPQRYFAGILPTPEPSPSQTTTIEPTPLPSALPTLEPSPIPTLLPSIEPTPELTQTPEPLPSPTPSEPAIEPVVQPTQLPEPTPEPTQTESPTPQPTPVVETPEPTAEPSPTPIPSLEPIPTPSLDPQEVTLEVPTQLLAIPGFEELAKSVAAIMNIGSDMTPEQREESQAVVISAVLVSQIATSIRRIK